MAHGLAPQAEIELDEIWYYAWGICIPYTFYETDALPNELMAFVDFSSEMSESPIPIEELRRSKMRLPGWRLLSKPEGRCIKFERADNLAKKPGGFTPAFTAWLSSAFGEADRLFVAAKSTI